MIDRANDNTYEITVIVPTYNRAQTLSRCLQALEGQTAARKDFEVIVVDDGSRDETAEVFRGFSASSTLNIEYTRQENSGQNAARNRAIGRSRGRILLFINDDTVTAPDVIDRHIAGHRTYPGEQCAVLGRVTISPDLPPSLFAKLHLDDAYSLWENTVELPWKAFYTCNLSIAKSFLMRYGTFDEALRYNDDIELAERLSHHGLRIFYDKRCLGYHYHYLTEDDYIRLAQLSGRTLVVWYKKAPHLKREIAEAGFYKGSSPMKRVKYFLADAAINGVTRPLLMFAARRLFRGHGKLGRLFYKKMYKSFERESIRRALGGDMVAR
jgi:glycosyltransferase involved in cell wall biosynthesis